MIKGQGTNLLDFVLYEFVFEEEVLLQTRDTRINIPYPTGIKWPIRTDVVFTDECSLHLSCRNQVGIRLLNVIGIERQVADELARLFLEIQFVFECDEAVVRPRSLMEMILDGAAILRVYFAFDLLVLWALQNLQITDVFAQSVLVSNYVRVVGLQGVMALKLVFFVPSVDV